MLLHLAALTLLITLATSPIKMVKSAYQKSFKRDRILLASQTALYNLVAQSREERLPRKVFSGSMNTLHIIRTEPEPTH